MLCIIGGLLISALAALPAGAEQDMAKYIGARELAHLLRIPGTVLLIDIREPEEFAVSHLAGARNINPWLEPDQLVARLRRSAPGKVLIVYCTVANRSADFVLFSKDHLKRAGAREVLVLKGGIFAWHNAGLPLVDRDGPTRFVHPYDAALVGRLLQPSLVRWSR